MLRICFYSIASHDHSGSAKHCRQDCEVLYPFRQFSTAISLWDFSCSLVRFWNPYAATAVRQFLDGAMHMYRAVLTAADYICSSTSLCRLAPFSSVYSDTTPASDGFFVSFEKIHEYVGSFLFGERFANAATSCTTVLLIQLLCGHKACVSSNFLVLVLFCFEHLNIQCICVHETCVQREDDHADGVFGLLTLAGVSNCISASCRILHVCYERRTNGQHFSSRGPTVGCSTPSTK